MNEEETEAQENISVADGECSKSFERIHLNPNDVSFHEVEGKSHATNDISKEVNIALEGRLHTADSLAEKVSHEVEGESHANIDHEKDVDDGVPKVGMTFATVKEAYDYYNRYAGTIGFSVRKQRTNKSRVDPNIIELQTLCCSCEGFYDEIRATKKRRENRRFGCKAMFEVRLDICKNYVATKFIAEHNHELASPENLHMLRSQRKQEPSHVEVVNKVQPSRSHQSEIFCYMCEEASGTENLSPVQSNSVNPEEKKRIEFQKRVDSQGLLDYFKQKKQENKHYYYSFWTSEDFEVRGIFFCDAKSRRDYGLFGDVLYCDTIFRTNDYNMVFTPIVGVNSHGQFTLFGCGLLDSETPDAVVWLFTSFLEAMGGKKPKTILSNESVAIANAIRIVYPETHHRLHLWHIYRNVVKHLAEECVQFDSLPELIKECIYDSETVEEFEDTWELLLKDYGLRDNRWLQGLYGLRRKWAQVYDSTHFCASMTTRQMSESIHNFLKTFFGSNLNLREFVDQYAKAMIEQREKEIDAENAQQSTSIYFSSWSIEHEAAKKYTNGLFYSFQDEYKRTLDHRLELQRDDGEICTYKVVEMESRRKNHILTYNQSEQSVTCTCRKFEFHGILCSHVLKLFRDLEFTCLPSRYYLKRWTRGAMDELVFDSYGEAISTNIDPLSTTRYSELSYIAQRIVMKGAKSSTMFYLAKSVMLELEAKIEAFLISEEEQRKGSISGTHDNLASNSNSDAPVRNKKTKRPRGPSKSKVRRVADTKAPKKMSPSKQIGNEGENVAMPDMIEGMSTVYQPTEEPFEMLQQPIQSQDQNQVPQWQGMCLPYNFMGCPDQSNRPFFASDYLFMSPQTSAAQSHEPQEATGRFNFPCSSTSYFPDSSTSQ